MSEYDFLKDTDNIKLVSKISNLVESQLPEFIKDEGGNFAEFLKFYYKWMETHELTISDVVQDEYHIILESEQGSCILETGSDLILENDRTNKSAYEKDEIITGATSGATHVLRVVDTSLDAGFADNANIETAADAILDFTEANPFGTP